MSLRPQDASTRYIILLMSHCEGASGAARPAQAQSHFWRCCLSVFLFLLLHPLSTVSYPHSPVNDGQALVQTTSPLYLPDPSGLVAKSEDQDDCLVNWAAAPGFAYEGRSV